MGCLVFNSRPLKSALIVFTPAGPRRRYVDVLNTSKPEVSAAPANMWDLMAPMAIPDLKEDQGQSHKILSCLENMNIVLKIKPSTVPIFSTETGIHYLAKREMAFFKIMLFANEMKIWSELSVFIACRG